MLKVFLVEDEFVVRQGIKKNIAWEEHGYEFCGDASDGELALPLIRRNLPDILITDIKMPFMDGLELSRIVRKEFPQIAIIILSGYEEFAYAKEAIRLGVSGYLLKPISGDALLKEVDQVAAQILHAREEQKIQEKYRREMQENARRDRQRFFADLVSGKKTVSQLFDTADQYSIDLSGGYYSILLVKLAADNSLPQEFSDTLVQANEYLEGFASEDTLLFNREPEGYGLLIKADTEEQLKAEKESFLSALRRIPEEYPGIHYAAGVGRTVQRLSQLKDSFAFACHAFAHRYFISGSCIIDKIESPSVSQYDTDTLSISAIDPKSINTTRIMDFLRTGDIQEIDYFIDDFYEDIGSQAMESMLFRQYIVLGMYFAVAEFAEEFQFPRKDLLQPDSNRLMSMGADFSRNYISDLLTQAFTIRENAANSRQDAMVEDTIRFIEANYANPDLTLNLAASHVKFSPNYLSRVFSEQTGETFIRFLTDYRITKAKEFLRCTTKKSSEIAYEVGYKDPHYFSFLFKKQTGLSPKQFRGGENPVDA